MKTMRMAVLGVSMFAAACGGATSVSGVIGPSGGVVRSASGLKLDVPAGALPAEVQVELRDVVDASGARHVEIEPRGQALDVAAHLEVEEQHAGEVELVEVHDDGTEAELENPLDDGHHASGELHHFGTVELRHHDAADGGSGSTGAACVTDDDCARGLDCVANACAVR